MKREGIIISTVLILGIFTTVFGQNNQHTESKADQALRGSGRVNPSSLGLEIDIPLGSYPGRGINVPIGLSYSSKLWRLEYNNLQPKPNLPDQCITINRAKYAENSASGWTTSLAVPYIEYTGEDNLFDERGFPVSDVICPAGQGGSTYYGYIKRLTVHLPSGETHELRATDTPVMYLSGQTPTFDWNTTFYAVDGSNIKYIENSATNTYRLLLPDGSFYDFTSTRTTLNLATIRKAAKFSDRNGNFTTYYAPGSVDDQGVTHPNGYWKDTLGRNVPVPFKPEMPTAPTIHTYKMPGLSASEPIIYKFHWKKLKDMTAVESGLTDFSQQLQLTSVLFPSDSDNSVIDTSGTPFNPIVLTAVELPTGQFYRFKYNIYGEIERVQYPTGGEERFEYAVVPPLGDTGNSNSFNSVHWKINRGIGSRKVYITAGSSETPLEWIYSAAKNGNYGYKISTTAPDATLSERLLHRGYDNCTGCTPAQGTWGYDNGLSGMPYEEIGYNSVGQVVSRKLTHWTKTTFPNAGYRTKDWHPRILQEETFVYDTAGNGVSATVRYEYEGNLSQIETPVLVNKATQYAFVAVGSGSSLQPGEPPNPNPTPVPTPIPPSPVRITETTYLINDTVNYPNQAHRDAYKNQNMVGLVTVSKIRDGANTIVAQSETKYDEAAYSLISAGTTAQWQDPYNNYRANPTTSRVWDSTKGLVTNTSAYLATHAQFDNFGNQRKVWDAKGNLSETDYSATYGYAFPTTVTTAIPDPTNVHGSNTAFQSSATFNATTGLPLTATDANGQTTTIEYDAATLRPIRVIPPSGAGISETVYHDEPNNYWVKNRAQIDATNWAESITYFDGLGRAYKAEQIDSQGNIFVEKEFDQDGRVKRVTNPFRTGETKQWTTNVYDEASRVKEVILPDGAKVITDYGISTETGFIGVTKQITDQAGKKRKGISDALGRMVRVIEDPTGQPLNTDYIFDTLGNLRKTIQGEQSRYFMHDSLGRLLYTKQPEQDANANFSGTNYTDAITSNNQWSVKYVYDDNGNITSTTDARNITVTGTYDNFNRLKLRDYSDPNTPDVSFYYDGKYLNINDVPQTATGSVKGKTTGVKSSVSRTNYTNFNNLGQLLTHQQITDGQTYQTSYIYNAFGKLLSETYPSGRTVKMDYNADGDVSSIWGTVGSQNRLYANGFSYNSSGAIERMRLGNGRWETAKYNERLQITEIGLGYSATDKSLLKLEYGYGTATENNGNLRTQKITFNGLAQAFEQTYTYDNLNRLQSAEEKVNTNTTWKQTFEYDRFGNRRFDAANTTTLGSCSQSVCNPLINTSDNRISSGQNYSYDANGNVTTDANGKQFLYDAENHQKEVKDASNNTIGLYLYDGEGKRVKKISATETTVFVYNGGGQLVAEYSTALAQTPQVSYLTADHLGSPRVITDQTGKVTTRKDYLAFGDEASSAQRTANPNYDSSETRKGYTGYEKDAESGLEFAQARYYNATHGRFTSVDPLTASASIKNPQTFNRYSYVLNSPYKFTDPLGLLSVTTNACGQWCSNSYQGEGRYVGSNGNFPSEQHAQEAELPLGNGNTLVIQEISMTVNNDNTITFSGDYFIKNDNGQEKVTDTSAIALLNDAIGRMASNVYAAIIKYDAITLFPVKSTTIELQGSAELGKVVKNTVPSGGEVSIGVSIEVTSADGVLSALRETNSIIRSKLIDVLGETSASPPVSGAVGEIKKMKEIGDKNGITIATKFGILANKTANQLARDKFKANFSDRKLPSVFSAVIPSTEAEPF